MTYHMIDPKAFLPTNPEGRRMPGAGSATTHPTMGEVTLNDLVHRKADAAPSTDGRRATDSKPSNPKDVVAVNKLPYSLVSPIVKAYQAISHYLGNVKYGAWNYRAGGASAAVYYSACIGHLSSWYEGEEDDPVDGTPHLANALACIDILIDAKHSGKLTDDRPPSLAPELARVRAKFEALMPQIRARYADRTPPRHFTIADTESLAEQPTPQDVLRRFSGHDGRGMPLALQSERLVEVNLRNGHQMHGPAGELIWRHSANNGPFDIVSWRYA